MNKKEMMKKYGNEFIGNVIRIIDHRTVLVNAGRNDLSVGQTVQIYEPCGEIKDLDGSVLSNYHFIKDELAVIQVEERYSVCQKQKSITKTYNPFVLSPLLETKKTEYIPLNIDEADIQEMKPKDPKVRIGDPIKLA